MNVIVPYFDSKNLFFSVFSNISPRGIACANSHSLFAEKKPAGQSIHYANTHGEFFLSKNKSSQDFTFLDLDDWMESLEGSQ